MALVAVQGRVDGNVGADRELVDRRADRGDHAGELVPGHDRQRRRELAVEDVQVRTAQAARRHGHHGLARRRRRVVNGRDLDHAGRADHGGSHAGRPPCRAADRTVARLLRLI
jgi:hypothetical protein